MLRWLFFSDSQTFHPCSHHSSLRISVPITEDLPLCNRTGRAPCISPHPPFQSLPQGPSHTPNTKTRGSRKPQSWKSDSPWVVPALPPRWRQAGGLALRKIEGAGLLHELTQEQQPCRRVNEFKGDSMEIKLLSQCEFMHFL